MIRMVTHNKGGSAMKVGLETVVSYFPEAVMKREDFSYIDPTIPPGMENMLRGPDE